MSSFPSSCRVSPSRRLVSQAEHLDAIKKEKEILRLANEFISDAVFGLKEKYLNKNLTPKEYPTKEI